MEKVSLILPWLSSLCILLGLAESFDAFCTYIDKFEGDFEHFLHTIFCNADATNLEQFVESMGKMPIEMKNIWFQCPWNEWNSPVSVRALLCNFFKSAAEVQGVGDSVYLGIFGDGSDFHSKYNYWQVVDAAEKCGYELQIETDKVLIRQCQRFGYIPCSSADRTGGLEREKEHLITHTFVRT
jgi:hypothetical protein